MGLRALTQQEKWPCLGNSWCRTKGRAAKAGDNNLCHQLTQSCWTSSLDPVGTPWVSPWWVILLTNRSVPNTLCWCLLRPPRGTHSFINAKPRGRLLGLAECSGGYHCAGAVLLALFMLGGLGTFPVNPGHRLCNFFLLTCCPTFRCTVSCLLSLFFKIA